MKRHIENTRKQLADLGAMASQTEADERAILENATKQLAVVQAKIDRARPGIEAAPEASQSRYADLVSEAGRLQIIIGKAQQALQK